ncbi:MAG: transglutaminase family protein [Burkholderiales bacterium]
MRFNPQETTGSRVRLNYSVELGYELDGPAEFLLNVHAARTDAQSVADEAFRVEPDVPVALAADPATHTRVASFAACAPRVTVSYRATVDIAHRIVDPQDIVAKGPAALPVATLRYLYPSRYCQADLLRQRAWDLFSALPRGYAQVLAVRDWVRKNIEFRIGVSCSTTTVLETLAASAGVCRDFAHTMIAHCRALNYPARFVTGVDYGADPALGPPDFHAYAEVFIGGAWYLFDATGISPVTGLIRIGTGRDAADVSFATIFGPVRTGMPKVSFSAVEDAAAGFVAPVVTELAVSTAW